MEIWNSSASDIHSPLSLYLVVQMSAAPVREHNSNDFALHYFTSQKCFVTSETILSWNVGMLPCSIVSLKYLTTRTLKNLWIFIRRFEYCCSLHTWNIDSKIYEIDDKSLRSFKRRFASPPPWVCDCVKILAAYIERVFLFIVLR